MRAQLLSVLQASAFALSGWQQLVEVIARECIGRLATTELNGAEEPALSSSSSVLPLLLCELATGVLAKLSLAQSQVSQSDRLSVNPCVSQSLSIADAAAERN